MDGMAVQPEHHTAEDVGLEGLLSFALLECLAPVGRGELEDAAARPPRQEAEEVAHVAERLEAVEGAAGQQGDEDGVHLGAVVTAAEEPVLPADDLPPEV